MERFLGWMKELRDRPGKLSGSIGLWIQGEEALSYTLLLSEKGVQLKTPGLRSADLVLSMKRASFDAWLEGKLTPESLASGDIAWDGDLQLFRELGYRMSHAPMLPHQSFIFKETS